MANTEQLCTFSLRGQHFGVPVESVQEVIRHQDTTPVPLVPQSISGLMNLRGQIVMTLDLRRRLRMKERDDVTESINLVVRTHDGLVSLLVDSIGDVVQVEKTTFEESPATLSPEMRQVITGVHKLEWGLLHVLDTEKVCNPCPASGEV